MTKKNDVYKCNVCGNITEVLHESGGTLSCCNQPMQKLEENSVEASKEKHIPVVTPVPGGYKVSVGSVEHPMEDKHFIEWIELVTESTVLRKQLKPGEKPEVIFLTDAKTVYAREYCNLHGHWRS